MKYFDYIDDNHLDNIFFKKPTEFNKETDKEILKYSLGSLLYIPATQYDMIYKTIVDQASKNKSIAICLEDAVGRHGEEDAINNLSKILKELDIIENTRNIASPLLFIRIKNLEQLSKLKEVILKYENKITGLLIPKVNANIFEECVNLLEKNGINKLYLIPIIESKEFIYEEIKKDSFESLYNSLLKYKSRVLGIRLGVTDILGMYGIRRSKQFSIYDNLICSTLIKDAIIYLNRQELDIPISGGVSELFDMKNNYIFDMYIEEILLDKYNGLIGKTVIHPNQVPIVQSLMVVSYEDYKDANLILDNTNSKYGVNKGILGSRMNEINPHLIWAKKIIILSKIYGVLKEGKDHNELLRF